MIPCSKCRLELNLPGDTKEGDELYWIAVHDEILGSKLRGFRKSIGCSDAEAVGILTCFWLWARNNTDITGVLEHTDKNDIACAIKPYLSKDMNPYTVADAMIEHHFVDDKDGVLSVHDWAEWQSYWYSHVEKKERDRNRKREIRASRMNQQPPNGLPEQQHDPPVPDAEKTDPPKKKTPKKPKEEKTAFAENVALTQTEYRSLVENHGEPFTEKLIFELNVYKGANGKKYKSDYMAILNWVVDKCRKKYPGIERRPPEQSSDGNGENPFSAYLSEV